MLDLWENFGCPLSIFWYLNMCTFWYLIRTISWLKQVWNFAKETKQFPMVRNSVIAKEIFANCLVLSKVSNLFQSRNGSNYPMCTKKFKIQFFIKIKFIRTLENILTFSRYSLNSGSHSIWKCLKKNVRNLNKTS